MRSNPVQKRDLWLHSRELELGLASRIQKKREGESEREEIERERERLRQAVEVLVITAHVMPSSNPIHFPMTSLLQK